MPDDGRDLDNHRLAAALREYAALLELAGSSHYAARAFSRAADLLYAAPDGVAELVRAGRAQELRGIGPGIDARLRELVATGSIAEVEALRRETSPELAALGRALGFGAALGARIGASLGITTVDELRAAAGAGRLLSVPGIGPKTEAKIVGALAGRGPGGARTLRLDRARALADGIAAALGGVVAGEIRRWHEAPSRIGVVVASAEPAKVYERFAALPEIVTLIDRSTGVSADGAVVELSVALPDQFGTELVRATGSEEFVEALGPLPAARDEASVFRLLGMSHPPPELRERHAPAVPRNLLELADIRGELHTHTTWSDGKATVLAMGEAARALGYDYLAICDHTTAVRVVPGLDAAALERQAIEIEAANCELAPFRVLRGIECDILPDGSLDLPDGALGALDWVQLSLHAGQRAPRRELTARVTHAMRHPAVTCLSHPTGRLIGHRPENALDLEATFEVAVEAGVAIEVNGLPARLDLSAENARLALEAGVALVCSTDAHSTRGLGNMPPSVHTARRAGADASQVVNTWPLDALMARFRSR